MPIGVLSSYLLNWIFKLKSGIRRLSDSTDIVFSPCAGGISQILYYGLIFMVHSL